MTIRGPVFHQTVAKLPTSVRDPYLEVQSWCSLSESY